MFVTQPRREPVHKVLERFIPRRSLVTRRTHKHKVLMLPGTALVMLALLAGFAQSPTWAAPAPPSGLKAVAGDTAITLSWNKTDASYLVRFRPAGVPDWQYRTAGSVGTYVVSGLTNAKAHEFQVRIKHRDSARTSSDSPSVWATPAKLAYQEVTGSTTLTAGTTVANVHLEGNRPDGTDRTGLANGPNAYSLANDVTFRNVSTEDIGTVWVAGGKVKNLTIEKWRADNLRRGLDVTKDGGVDGLVIRDFDVRNFSKSGKIRNCNNVLIENGYVESNQIKDEPIPQGFAFDDCSNVTVRNVAFANMIWAYTSGYPQGEAIAIERGVTNAKIENVSGVNMADALFDLKSATVMKTVKGERHGRGIRLWAAGNVIDGYTSVSPNRSHLQMNTSGHVNAYNVNWKSTSPTLPLVESAGDAYATIHSGTICRHPSAPMYKLDGGRNAAGVDAKGKKPVFGPDVKFITPVNGVCPN